MLSAFVLASIASAYAAVNLDLNAETQTHVADTFNAVDIDDNRDGDFNQNTRAALFVVQVEDAEDDNVAVDSFDLFLQTSGIELQNEDGDFIERNRLGLFVGQDSCSDVLASNRNAVRFEFSDRGASGQNLNNQFLQDFNLFSVNLVEEDRELLVGPNFEQAVIRDLSQENIDELVGAARSVILFQNNNVNRQLFCMDLVAKAEAELDDDLADLLALTFFEEGSFAGFNVEDIVLTCDDRGQLEQIERGFGGVVGFGVFEADVPNPANANQVVTGTTLLVDGIQVTEWDARLYGNFEAVVSDTLCNGDNDEPNVLQLEDADGELQDLRIEDIDLNADNWVQGSGLRANSADDADAISDARIEQGSLREALIGSATDLNAKSMFLLLDERAIACCDLKDIADAIEDGDINIDFLNDVAEAESTETEVVNHDNGNGYDKGNGNGDNLVDSAASVVVSAVAAAFAAAALF